MSHLNPSWRTICALLTSMIGGTMLTLPILFRDAGILIGVFVLIITGLISYKTCSLYVLHMSYKQQKIQDTIHRLLGKKGQDFFRLITGIYLVFLNIIYVELIADQFFNIIYFILHKVGHGDWISEKNQKQIIFNKFSIQIVSLIFFVPLLLTMFIKNLSFLVKLTALGVFSVITYTCYIFYKFFQGIHKIAPDTRPPLFAWKFGNLVGTSAVAFTIHTVVNPIIKANQIQQNNLRDLKISYICGFFIYASIGVLGSLAIIGQDCNVTIINCYLQEYKTLVVEILYFFMLLTVFPCFINVGRTRLLTRLFGCVHDKHVTIFNFVFIFLSTLFAFLSPFLRLDLLMNLAGSLFCFFFIYYIPIRFHWECLYGEKDYNNLSLITYSNSIDRKNFQQNQQAIQIGQKIKCAHSNNYVSKRSRLFRLISYTIIMTIGIAVGIYGIYDFIDQVIKSIKDQ